MQTYATSNDVRLEAWFQWNPNVTNDTIEKYIVMWHSIVLSRIAWKYNTTLFEGDNFTDSQAHVYLKTAEILISAGLLLQKEFGTNYEAEKEGARRFKDWNDMLMMMFDPKTPVFLIGNDGIEYPRKSVWTAWSITATSYSTGEPFFGVNMKI